MLVDTLHAAICSGDSDELAWALQQLSEHVAEGGAHMLSMHIRFGDIFDSGACTVMLELRLPLAAEKPELYSLPTY